MNSRNLLLTVLEAGSPKSGSEHVWVLAKALFWAADCQLLVVSSHGRRDQGALWGFFYKSTNPIHEGSMNFDLRT